MPPSMVAKCTANSLAERHTKQLSTGGFFDAFDGCRKERNKISTVKIKYDGLKSG